MLVPIVRQCVRFQGSLSLCKSVRAPCHHTATLHHSQLQRLQSADLHAANAMSTAAEDGSSTTSAPAGTAPPPEAQSDAETKTAKDQAGADAPTDEFRLQTIKDRMFWTHGSQVELAAQMADRVIASGASFCLIGDSSHGTHEFYTERAHITKQLFLRGGFIAVMLEADFPDAFQLNLWVRGFKDGTVDDALVAFKRFPLWMWRNEETKEFVQWMKERNDNIPLGDKTTLGLGIYGMDVYSLHTSMDAVVKFLEKVDPERATKAKQRYSCFDKFGDDAIDYAWGLARGVPGCTDEAINMLVDMRKKYEEYRQQEPGLLGQELAFEALVNAAVVADAEVYYRNMLSRDELTWNLRDSHMVETVEALRNHLKDLGIAEPKIVVWAHNSHVGDARFTDMGRKRGEVNVGQLMRERYGEPDVFNIACFTHHGSVAAAEEWGAPIRRRYVRPSGPGSYENLFQKTLVRKFALDIRWGEPELKRALAGPLLERFIGVIYAPETERYSHYAQAWLDRQFDAVIFFDKTRAVKVLSDDPAGDWEENAEDPPETYPFGM